MSFTKSIVRGCVNCVTSPLKRNVKYVVGFVLLALVVVVLGFQFRRRRSKYGSGNGSGHVIWTDQTYQRINQMCRNVPSSETIFVSIPSYRDPELLDTVLDCFSKAACPYRINLGICQQNERNDQDLEKVLFSAMHCNNMDPKLVDRVRIISMSASEAKGPMFARAAIEQELYSNEKYFLMIDSHTWFAPDWDMTLIKQLAACNSSKPILTAYPPDYRKRAKENNNHANSNNVNANVNADATTNHADNVNVNVKANNAMNIDSSVTISSSKTTSSDLPTFMRLKRFHRIHGFPELEGPHFRTVMSTPCPALFWGACLSFSYGALHTEVPMDPNYPYVFIGEEIAMAARYFTHGWDLFHPNAVVLKHRWKRERPTFWEQFRGLSTQHQARQEQEKFSYGRLKQLFRLKAPRANDLSLGKYDLGTKRTIDDYSLWCGVDFLLCYGSPHAFLGVSLQPTEEEILAKFDSLTEYRKQKRNFANKKT